MYQKIVGMCSSPERASGPAIDVDVFLSSPVYQDDVTDHLIMIPRRKWSRHVSELLDRLGYSYEMIKYRQQMYEECNAALNRHQDFHTRVITGGKGEGTSLYYEGDTDTMLITEDVICTENPHDFIHQENITLFLMERHGTSPGYTRLKKLGTDSSGYDECLLESETGSHFLSSQSFTDEVRKNNIKYFHTGCQIDPVSGPSTPASSKYLKLDNVTCFKCFCPDIVERWVARPRYHGWPSPDTVHEISLLDGHVVPVGSKGSQDMDREWRICYSLAELHLIRNFTQTQIKVYVLLKKISKSVLNPVCEHMTSYIMKNVVLWICETNGVDRFTLDMLMDRLLECITYLRTCVSDNNLPSYMIPDRNLLAGRLDDQQRKQLVGLLSDLLHDGGRMILRCDQLRDAMLVMYKIPNTFSDFSEKRDKIERLVAMMLAIRLGSGWQGIALKDQLHLLSRNEQYLDIESRVHDMIQFDVDALVKMGKTDEEIIDLRLSRLSGLIS